jgi:hypothetical protein
MKPKITVITVPVTKAGELNFFAINLPRDIDRIVGMQAGVSSLNNMNAAYDRYLAGTVKVQAENYADLCYSCEISIGQGSIEKSMTGFTTPDTGLLKLFTLPNVDTGMHQMQLEGCYTLYGCYEDVLIKALNIPVTYIVRLYVWTETDEEE